MHKRSIALVFITGFLVLNYGCSPPQQGDNKSKKPIIKEVKDQNGILKSRLTIVDNKLHGKVTRFYPNGKIKTESEYVNNHLNGSEKKLYQDGTVYRTREYVNDTLNGIEYRYYRNGKIMTRQEYKNNNPAVGLEEYSMTGQKTGSYPKLKFKMIHERDYKEQTLLITYLDDSYTNIRFYDGGLIEGKYYDSKAIPISSNKGVSEKRIDPDFSGEIIISCKAITPSRGLYIASGKVLIKQGKIIKQVSL